MEGCSDDCGLDLRLTSREGRGRLFSFQRLMLMTYMCTLAFMQLYADTDFYAYVDDPHVSCVHLSSELRQKNHFDLSEFATT